MDLISFLQFLNFAKEKEQEEQIYSLWVSCVPHMEKFKPFIEFKNEMLGGNVDKRNDDEIIKEILEKHPELGGTL